MTLNGLYFQLAYFIFVSSKNSLRIISLLSHCHVTSFPRSLLRLVITLWVKLSYSLLMSARVLWYRTVCRQCLRPEIVLKFRGPKDITAALKHDISSATNSPVIFKQLHILFITYFLTVSHHCPSLSHLRTLVSSL